jgi:hypothetical protein
MRKAQGDPGLLGILGGAMSEENVELMRRIVAMFNEAGDIDRDETHARAAAVYHPDVEVPRRRGARPPASA